MSATSQQPGLTLAAFGDLHIWRFGLDWDFAPKRLLGLANLALRRARRFPIAIQTAIIERLTAEDADHILFTGDISTTSLRAEFEQGQMLLAPLMLRWGERFHAIPGNHDRYTPRAARRRDFERLFLGHAQTYPYTVRLNTTWSLVAIDASVPRALSSRGRMSDEAIAALDAELAREQAAGRQIAVLGHYPLAYPERVRPSWEHVLPERERVLEVLAGRGVKLYLHGHKHWRWLVERAGILHANCGSAGLDSRRRRAGYIRVRIDGPRIAGVAAVSLNPQWTPDLPAGDAWALQELAPEACRGAHARP